MRGLQRSSRRDAWIHAIISALRPLPFRGKVRLLQPLVPRAGERVARVFGANMRLDLQDYIQRMIYLGTFEPEETAVLRRLLRPGSTFVDVGANVGYFSLLAASMVGAAGRVLAVEPFGVAVERLRETIVGNAISNLIVERCALGSANGVAVLPTPRADNQAPSLLGQGDGERVHVRRLDGLLEELGFATVDCMKVDVEGYEHEVLRGAGELLRSGAIRAILIEFNAYWLGRAGTSPIALDEFLHEAGYRSSSPVDCRSLANRLYWRSP